MIRLPIYAAEARPYDRRCEPLASRLLLYSFFPLESTYAVPPYGDLRVVGGESPACVVMAPEGASLVPSADLIGKRMLHLPGVGDLYVYEVLVAALSGKYGLSLGREGGGACP